MLKKILLSLLVLIFIVVVVIFALFYKPNLSKDDLASIYISEQSKFIKLGNGANMHYRDEGNPDGNVLVMIHGGFGSLHNWEGWADNLKEDYRLISMDLLGHGLTGKYQKNLYDRHSERDAVHQLLQKLGVQKYSVAGNSFGGGVALEIALQYPQEVEGLILVDSEGVPNGEDGYDTSLFNDDDPMTPDDPDFYTLSFLERVGSHFISKNVIKSTLDSMVYNKDLLTDDFVDYYSKILRYEGNREAQLLMFRQGMYLISKNGKMDLLPRLKEIKCPTLIIQGKQDTLVPMRVAETFKENIANSTLFVVDNAGHMPMIEKPKETAKVVKDFMQTLIAKQ